MSHRDKEPAGLTVVKVIGAVVLVIVAIAFGAGGACGVVVVVVGIGESLSRRAIGSEAGIWLIGAGCAFLGFGSAIRLARAANRMLRKREEPREERSSNTPPEP
jgi:hypothetical protein